VGVDDAAWAEAAQAGGHVHSVDDQAGTVMIGHGAADDLAGREIQSGRQVEPALGGGDVGDVADHAQVSVRVR
jgi:hypothetical protein